jgi:hypothetical protein
VNAKFGSAWGGWCSFDPPGSHGVGLYIYFLMTRNISKAGSLCVPNPVK